MTPADPPTGSDATAPPPPAPEDDPYAQGRLGAGPDRGGVDDGAGLGPEHEPEPSYPRPHPWRRQMTSVPWGRVVLVAAVALVAFGLGVITGSSTAVSGSVVAASTLERELLPLARAADAIWTDEGDGGPPVAVAVTQLRREGDVAAVRANVDAWLRTYDRVLRDMARIEVPPVGRAVQRQFLAGVVVSRDALEVLDHAVEVDSAGGRRLLVAESIRLRSRSESLSQAARTSLNRLVDVGRASEDQNTSVPPRLPPFDELASPPPDDT